MRHPTPLGALWFTLVVVAACNEPVQAPKAVAPPEAPPLLNRTTPSRDEPDALSGGATTVFNVSSEAFEQPAPNLDAAGLARHDAGDEGFGETFVANSGLGPLFNNSSCEACHVGDGRGRPPLPGESFTTMLFRASIPGRDEHGGPMAAGL